MKKNAVRECDEAEAGHFVAYADEGSSSFDVSVTVLPGDKIGKSSCDCGSTLNFCRHKEALVIHLAQNKKVKSPVKLKKEGAPTQSLMDDIEFGRSKSV